LKEMNEKKVKEGREKQKHHDGDDDRPDNQYALEWSKHNRRPEIYDQTRARKHTSRSRSSPAQVQGEEAAVPVGLDGGGPRGRVHERELPKSRRPVVHVHLAGGRLRLGLVGLNKEDRKEEDRKGDKMVIDEMRPTKDERRTEQAVNRFEKLGDEQRTERQKGAAYNIATCIWCSITWLPLTTT